MQKDPIPGPEQPEQQEQEQTAPEQQEQTQSKFADYIHSDGRPWAELTPEEKQKVRKKLNKKKKKKKKAQSKATQIAKHSEKMKGKGNFEKELKWCIDQIKLGLTANAVTPDQCKLRLIGSEGVC
jgi:uncharacterized protein YaaW (UPF0174 family)